MYIVRAEYSVQLDREAAFVERVGRLGEYLGGQDGFRSIVVLNSFGYPGRYATLSTWESRGLQRAVVRSEQYLAWHHGDPPIAGATQNRPAEAYALVNEVAAEEGSARSVTLTDWSLDGDVGAFESNTRELFGRRSKLEEGFVSDRLLRFLGAPGRYLLLHEHASGELLPPAVLPEVAELERGLAAPGGRKVEERYEVIRVIGVR